MIKSLALICEDLREQIHKDFDLGHGDAEELFKLIWTRMTAGPSSRLLQAAINDIERVFDF